MTDDVRALLKELGRPPSASNNPRFLISFMSPDEDDPPGSDPPLQQIYPGMIDPALIDAQKYQAAIGAETTDVPVSPVGIGAYPAGNQQSAAQPAVSGAPVQKPSMPEYPPPPKNTNNSWTAWTDPFMKGLAGFNTNVATFALKGPFSYLNLPLNVSRLLGYNIDDKIVDHFKGIEQSMADRIKDARQTKGIGYDVYSTVMEGIGSAAPTATLAVLSGGTSLPGTLPVLAESPSTAATVIGGLTKTVSNPSFIPSYIQSYGTSYNNAIDSGATENEAMMAATISGLLQSGAQITGSSNTVPAQLKDGGAAVLKWVQSMLRQGGENVVQNVIDKLTAKAVYDPDKPLFSATDSTAVFNPRTALQDFGSSAVLNALLSGGQFGANRLLQQLSKTRDEYLDLFKKQQGNQKLTGKGPDELIKSDWNNPGKGPEYIKIPNTAAEDATLVSALVKDYTGNTEQPPKAAASDKLSQEITASWYGSGAEASHGTGDVLPNVGKVTVDTRKVTEYALNPNNISGGANKARVFESALGYNQSNSNHLMQQIQNKLPNSKAVLGTADKYGQRFTMDIQITGPNGKTAIVRTGWILEPGLDVPRMTTIFVK